MAWMLALDMKADQLGNRRGLLSFMLVCLLLAGCCDKSVLERCRAETQARLAVLEKPPIESKGLMRFEVAGVADAHISVEVASANCLSGKSGAAEVRINWEITEPSVRGVRAEVGMGDRADKVWIESGPKGGGVTGPWIQDGSLIRLHDSFGGHLLGEIRVVGLPCGGV